MTKMQQKELMAGLRKSMILSQIRCRSNRVNRGWINHIIDEVEMSHTILPEPGKEGLGVFIRRFETKDEQAVSDLIAVTMRVSNSRDYKGDNWV